jgi:hypothetical protein
MGNNQFSFLERDGRCRNISNGPTKCYRDLLLTIIKDAESYDNHTIQKLIQLLFSFEERAISFNITIPYSSTVFRVFGVDVDGGYNIKSIFNPTDGTVSYCSNFYDSDSDSDSDSDGDDASAVASKPKKIKGNTEINKVLKNNGAEISNSRVLGLLNAILKKRAAAPSAASSTSRETVLRSTISKEPRPDIRPWCKYIFTKKGCTRDPNDMDGIIKHYHRFKHPGKDVRNMQFMLSNGKAVLSKKWRGGNAVSIKSRKSKYTRYHKHKPRRRPSTKRRRRTHTRRHRH